MYPADSPIVSATELHTQLGSVVILDCRFSLVDPDEGAAAYREAHLPGAHYLHLERQLSAPTGLHGGRHPLPDPLAFCQLLAEHGIGRDTPVVAYDASRLAYAARLWWMMDALGYTAVKVLDGGIAAWLAAGGALDQSLPPDSAAVKLGAAHQASSYQSCLDIEGLRRALERGAVLIDSREEPRYHGLQEPIDPVAGHIPGAVNFPWQGVTDAQGGLPAAAANAARWEAMDTDRELVVYCGSGVTACVNLLSLRLAGHSRAALYAGSWSDWCSYL